MAVAFDSNQTEISPNHISRKTNEGDDEISPPDLDKKKFNDEKTSSFDGFPVMTKETIRCAVLEHGGYSTPALNDSLYLHYKGYRDIENLEEYVNLKALWLDSNGLDKIKNLSHLHNLRSLFLQRNLIKSVENLDGLNKLVQLDLSENSLTGLNGLEHLPELSILNVSKNCLANSTSIFMMRECPKISSIDFSHNHLRGEDIIDTLSGIRTLLSINMLGNPVTTAVSHYRKRMICANKLLRYLDTPIFDAERATAEAWWIGGRDAELKKKTELQDKMRQEEKENMNAFRTWQQQIREKVLEKKKQISEQGPSRDDVLDEEAAEKIKLERQKAASIQAAKDRELYLLPSCEIEELKEEEKSSWTLEMDNKLWSLAKEEAYDFDVVSSRLGNEFPESNIDSLGSRMRWMILNSEHGVDHVRPLDSYIHDHSHDRLTFDDIQSMSSKIVVKPDALPSIEDM